jgi:hypothetical protein
MGKGTAIGAFPPLFSGVTIHKVKPLGLWVPELLPTVGQWDPDAGPEPLDESLAVQPTADEDYLVQNGLALLPRLVTGPVTYRLMYSLEDKLLTVVTLSIGQGKSQGDTGGGHDG